MEENISNSELPFCFQRGTDPRTATCRGKLQTKRCKLNQEINKELRLRAGAENLFKATTNRKLKDTVALELSFVNSNLQLLKEQLSELNSSVEIYQNSNYEPVIPMIPLGLKETKEVNFTDSFSDFILEHYSEDSSLYGEAIADITDTRQSARIPTRDYRGITLLFRYYNLLYFVERRFFPSDRSLGIYFEWFDSLTGVPSCQRTVAFEKACILFNLGAIYTQIGARQDRCSEKGLDTAVDNFLRAAGVFKHILETFTNAPSMDLKPQFLEILVNIMLSQARECLFEKLQLQIEQFTSLENIDHLHRDLSGECAQLFNEYNYIHSNILLCDINTYLPECWIGLVSLKAEYYKVLAHYYASKSIYQTSDGQTINNNNNNIGIHSKNSSKSNSLSDKSFFIDFDENELDLFTLKRLHLRESLLGLEEAKRLQRMCRELKNKQTITNVLYAVHTNLKNEINELNLDGEKLIDQEFEMCDAPITPSTKFTMASTVPDFISFKIEDPFKKLGPIAIFSARRHWTAPRSIRLQKGTLHIDLMNGGGGRKSKLINCECRMSTFSKECEVCQRYTASKVEYESPESFGFQVRGDAPVIVSNVESNSLADLGGMKEGDFIVEISGIDVKWYSHQQILNLVQCNGPSIDLKVITPMDRNYLKPLALSKSLNSDSTPCLFSPILTPSSTPDISPKLKAHRKLSKTKLLENVSCGGWNPFKRTNSLGKIF